MLAQGPGARRGLIDAAHVRIVATATLALPRLRSVCPIKRAVTLLAGRRAPVIGGIAGEFSGKRTTGWLRGEGHHGTVNRRRRFRRCYRHLIGVRFAVFEQRVLLDL